MNSDLTVLARFSCSFAVSLMVLKSASVWQQSATCVLVELKRGEFQHGKMVIILCSLYQEHHWVWAKLLIHNTAEQERLTLFLFSSY